MVSKPNVDFSIDAVSGEVHITQVLQVSPPASPIDISLLLCVKLLSTQTGCQISANCSDMPKTLNITEHACVCASMVSADVTLNRTMITQ